MTIVFDENGLTIPTQEARRERLAERLRARFGPNLKTEAPSVMGQIIDVHVELMADDDQALLSTFRSFDPNGATGRPLDARLALTGTTRKGATLSVVDGQLVFTSAGTANNGDLIRNTDNNSLWRVTDGPHASVGPWPETIPAQLTAVEPGPILANAGTSWELVTVVAGLDRFENPIDDAEPGQARESVADVRRRRLDELHAQGQGPLAAIKGAVSRATVNGTQFVQFVRVYHNPDEFPVGTRADNLDIPFKAFNVVVETNPLTPTADQQQAIFDAIWSAMGAGGEAFGTDFAGTVVDSEGTAQPVAFDTIDIVDIVLEVDLVTTNTEDPITPNLAAVVAERILERATAELEEHGRDVRRIDIQGIVFDMLHAGEITGPYAVDVRMAIAPASPADVDRLVIGIREKPDFDSANITVQVV